MTEDRERRIEAARLDGERRVREALQGRPSMLMSLTEEQLRMIRDLPPDVDPDLLGADRFREGGKDGKRGR